MLKLSRYDSNVYMYMRIKQRSLIVESNATHNVM